MMMMSAVAPCLYRPLGAPVNVCHCKTPVRWCVALLMKA